jgi:hypothetical protein
VEDVGEIVGRLTAGDLDRKERSRLLLALSTALGAGARAAGARAAVSGRWLADVLSEQVAPRLPVRDLLTLRQHHGGLSGDELAAALVTNASRTTAGVGAAAGAITAAEMAAPPLLLTAPVLLSAQTLVVVAVELKLVAELHVVYGRAPLGTRGQVVVAYLTAWATRKPVAGAASGQRPPPLAGALTAVLKQQLRQRVARRLARNVSSLVPFMAGAVAGAELNRRETRSLGEALQRDLRRRP